MARLAPAVRRALNEAATRRRTRLRLEQQLRDIVVTSQDWIWEHDRDGRFTFCSDSVRTILGYAPEEMLGTHASQYVHPEDLAALDFAMHTLGPTSAPRPTCRRAGGIAMAATAGWNATCWCCWATTGRSRVTAAANATSPSGGARKSTSAA